jgi:hypothetical protein
MDSLGEGLASAHHTINDSIGVVCPELRQIEADLLAYKEYDGISQRLDGLVLQPGMVGAAATALNKVVSDSRDIVGGFDVAKGAWDTVPWSALLP